VTILRGIPHTSESGYLQPRIVENYHIADFHSFSTIFAVDGPYSCQTRLRKIVSAQKSPLMLEYLYRGPRAIMKNLIIIMIFCALTAVSCTRINLQPVAGPMSEIEPVPIVKATARLSLPFVHPSQVLSRQITPTTHGGSYRSA